MFFKELIKHKQNWLMTNQELQLFFSGGSMKQISVQFLEIFEMSYFKYLKSIISIWEIDYFKYNKPIFSKYMKDASVL